MRSPDASDPVETFPAFVTSVRAGVREVSGPKERVQAWQA